MHICMVHEGKLYHIEIRKNDNIDTPICSFAINGNWWEGLLAYEDEGEALMAALRFIRRGLV